MKRTSAFAFLAAFLMSLLLSPLAWSAESKSVTGMHPQGKHTKKKEDSEQQRMQKSANVLQAIMKIPEKGIPRDLLHDAGGIAIIPSAYKAGFVVGGTYGKGVLAVRDENGRWGNPFFITLVGGSVGYQIGAQATDVVLVFKNRMKAEAVKNGKFTLGADASIAAGPVGRKAEAATDVTLKSEILSYSRSRGLFAGVSLGGSALEPDNKSTEKYYGKPVSEVQSVKKVPAGALELKRVLDRYSKEKE
ncbi:MAG: lipid-binding SYLF domain-containing protein [Desulfobacteraceae bacterium]|nr:lipid-binding SYLF domain-containing protein [Desulfobacteraceae bacterium]